MQYAATRAAAKQEKDPEPKLLVPGSFSALLNFLCICKGDNVKKILTKIFQKIPEAPTKRGSLFLQHQPGAK